MREATLALTGAALTLVSPALFFRSCADHCGSSGIDLFGFEAVRFLGAVVSYCTGGSQCTVGLGPVLLVVGLLLVGAAVVRR